MFDIPCVIFAGGKSSRMGEDKALLPFGDAPTMTQYQYNKLSNWFSKVYISCKSRDKFSFEADFIEDEDSNYSPLSGFVTLFDKLEEERFFVISVDTPFISQHICETIIKADTNDVDATVAQLDNKFQPLCGIYHRSLHKQFLLMQEQNLHKLTFLLQQSKTKAVPFNDQKSFLNLNNKQHYTQALEIINSALL